jgi:hypothetical protein
MAQFDPKELFTLRCANDCYQIAKRPFDRRDQLGS